MRTERGRKIELSEYETDEYGTDQNRAGTTEDGFRSPVMKCKSVQNEYEMSSKRVPESGYKTSTAERIANE